MPSAYRLRMFLLLPLDEVITASRRLQIQDWQGIDTLPRGLPNRVFHAGGGCCEIEV